MKIILSPQRRDDILSLFVQGDTITINGELFDFTPLQDGSTLPKSAVDCQWLSGDITRKGGQIELTIILPHTQYASEAARFPEPIIITDGQVELPV